MSSSVTVYCDRCGWEYEPTSPGDAGGQMLAHYLTCDGEGDSGLLAARVGIFAVSAAITLISLAIVLTAGVFMVLLVYDLSAALATHAEFESLGIALMVFLAVMMALHILRS